MNTTVADNVRTPETRKMLDQAEAFLEEFDVAKLDHLCHSAAIKDVLGKIRNAWLEFDAKLFFLAVFRPLKAGKSTLVNVLARSYVSPTEWGKETTVYPSIVIQSPETGIDQYFPLNSDIERERLAEAFTTVINYLRGTVNEQELSKLATKRTLPLNRDELHRNLTQKADRKPLITVIRVPGGHLVQPGVALLDLPGLDGVQSNCNKDPVQQWVIYRSDFLLFVQSSMAALNNETIECLRAVVKERNPPIWLIQNRMDAAFWRAPSKLDEDAQRQREQAVKQ